MFIGHARVRRASAVLGVIAVIGVSLFSPLIVNWFWRGQSAEEAAQLTGRTKVWTEILGLQRPSLEQAFGSGLSNKSFNGLSIDNNWLAVYLDQGWFGVALVALLLLVLIFLAVMHRRGVRRAAALVPHHLLPGGLDHRDRARRRVTLPARSRCCGLAAGSACRR